MVPEEHVPPDGIWRHLTIPQMEVPACLAAGLTERETADRLQLRVSSVRRTIDSLRRLTGFRRGADMGAWWRTYRDRYAVLVARAAGVRFGG